MVFREIFPLIIFALFCCSVYAVDFLSQSTFQDGSNITVTCSIKTVGVLEVVASEDIIESRLYWQKNEPYSEEKELYRVMRFQGGIVYIVEGYFIHNWKTFMEGNEQEPKRINSLITRISFADCRDEGFFICQIAYFGEFSIEYKEKKQLLRYELTPSKAEISLSIDPDHRASGNQYQENIPIKLTCVAWSPSNHKYKFYWSSRCNQPVDNVSSGPSVQQLSDSFKPWSAKKDIGKLEKKLFEGRGQCNKYRYTQTLRFRMKDYLHHTLFRCMFDFIQEPFTKSLNASLLVNLEYFGIGRSEMQLSIEPNHTMNGNMYDENTKVQITCRAEGPSGYNIFWSVRCAPATPVSEAAFRQIFIFYPWPVEGDIGTLYKYRTKNKHMCGINRFRQTLSFTMTKKMQKCEVRSEFGTSRLSVNNLIEELAINLKGSSSSSDYGQPHPFNHYHNSVAIGCLAIVLLMMLIYLCSILCFIGRREQIRRSNAIRAQSEETRTSVTRELPLRQRFRECCYGNEQENE